MRGRWIVVPALALVALAGCAAGEPEAAATPSPTASRTEPATKVVIGTLAVEADFAKNVASDQISVDGPCTVEAGYDDQREGAKVAILDASGTTVALGELRSKGLQILDGSTGMIDTWCGFGFTVVDVPTGEGFYSVVVGDRDPYPVSEDELFHGVQLTLGDVPGQS